MVLTFDGIKAEIKARLSLMSSWNTTLYFGVYERIIDFVAYIFMKLVYIAEFYYRESSWQKAQRTESLLNMADFLSYIAHRRIGASGVVLISSSSTFGTTYVNTLNDVLIPKWTVFKDSTKAHSVYSIEDTIYYRNAVGNLSVSVKEGVPKEYNYIAQGTVSEIITIFSNAVDEGVDDEMVDVFIVDAEGNILQTVTVVENLYLVNDLTQYYCEVKNNYDFSNIQIIFGDGLNTPKLTAGDYILVRYADTTGSNGNIQATGIINSITDTLVDSTGTAVTLYVTNTSEITGGLDVEDIESIRNNGRNLFASGYRLGSSNDWPSIIDAIPFIDKSAIWTVEDIGGSTLIAEQNTVFVTALNTDGNALTTIQKTDAELNYIKTKNSVTETITWQDTVKIYGFFSIVAKITNQTSTVVTQQIIDVLDGDYGSLNTEYMTNIYESNYTAAIDNLENVLYHETQLYNMEKNVDKAVATQLIAPSYMTTDTTVLADQVWLVNDTFKIWFKGKQSNVWDSGVVQIAHDVSGVIINDDPTNYTITGGVVDVANNTYTYSIASATGSGLIDTGVQNPGNTDPNGFLLYVSYKTKDGYGNHQNAIRLPRKYQITDIDEDFVMCILSYV